MTRTPSTIAALALLGACSREPAPSAASTDAKPPAQDSTTSTCGPSTPSPGGGFETLLGHEATHVLAYEAWGAPGSMLPEARSYPLAGLFVRAAVAKLGRDAVRDHLFGATPSNWTAACERAGTTPAALEAAYEATCSRCYSVTVTDLQASMTLRALGSG